tara:strand:- start:20 stop:274 length:255 start_codon:yes stop_codon:yes gene_type:complete
MDGDMMVVQVQVLDQVILVVEAAAVVLLRLVKMLYINLMVLPELLVVTVEMVLVIASLALLHTMPVVAVAETKDLQVLEVDMAD